ncbi:unnamed protein product, partial [Candidula unifasciata]
QCAKAVLNIQWQNLEEDSSLRQNFLASLANLHGKLVPFDFPRFRLLEALTENPWTNPTLAKVMGGEVEDGDKEEVRAYIEQEDPIILQLRVDMMLQENCEEYALNLCNNCLSHPELQSDLGVRKIQLSLLYKLGQEDKLQEECQKLNIQDAVRIIKQLQTSETHRQICTVLAQTFMVQNWIRPSDMEANKELLRLWIRHQLLVDREQDQFKESVWAMAKLSQSTEQIVIFIDVLREECGEIFLQLYVDMCIFAINVDKGQMETNKKEGNMEAAAARRSDMASICAKLACLCHHASIKVARICALTSFALKPTEQSFMKIGTFYGQGTDCCNKCGRDRNREPGTINPATLYEVERLLSMLRPDYLSPDQSYTNIQILCRRFLQESLKNAQQLQRQQMIAQNSGITTLIDGTKVTVPAGRPTNVFEALSAQDYHNTQMLLNRMRIQSITHTKASMPGSPGVQHHYKGHGSVGVRRGEPTSPAPAGQVNKAQYMFDVEKIKSKQPYGVPVEQQHQYYLMKHEKELEQRRKNAQKKREGKTQQGMTSNTQMQQQSWQQQQSQQQHGEQVNEMIQSALQDSDSLQKLTQSANPGIVQAVINIMKGSVVKAAATSELKRQQAGSQQMKPIILPSQQGTQPLPTVSTLLKPSVQAQKQQNQEHLHARQQQSLLTTEQSPPKRHPRPQLYAQPIVVSTASSLAPQRYQSSVVNRNNSSTASSSGEKQKGEGFVLAKSHVEDIRRLMQMQMSNLQQKQIAEPQHMSGSTVTVKNTSIANTSLGFASRPRTTVELAEQAALAKLQKHDSSKPGMFQQSQQLSSNSGQMFMSQSKQALPQSSQQLQFTPSMNSTDHIAHHQPPHQHQQKLLQLDQQQMNTFSFPNSPTSNLVSNPVLPSDELSGSIMGIDDTIIKELLQDSGILANTFPDIDVETVGEDKSKFFSLPHSAMPPLSTQMPKSSNSQLYNYMMPPVSQTPYTAQNLPASQQSSQASSITAGQPQKTAGASHQLSARAVNKCSLLPAPPCSTSTVSHSPLNPSISRLGDRPPGKQHPLRADMKANVCTYPKENASYLYNRKEIKDELKPTVDQLREIMKKEDIEGEVCMDAANNATYRCIICSIAFESLDYLREHVRNVCKPGLQSSSVYNTKIKQDRANSAKAGVETTTVFQCLRCFELCVSDAGIKQHRLTCKRVPTVPSDLKKESANNKQKFMPKSAISKQPPKKVPKDHADMMPDLPLPFPYPSLNAEAVLKNISQASSLNSQISDSSIDSRRRTRESSSNLISKSTIAVSIPPPTVLTNTAAGVSTTLPVSSSASSRLSATSQTSSLGATMVRQIPVCSADVANSVSFMEDAPVLTDDPAETVANCISGVKRDLEIRDSKLVTQDDPETIPQPNFTEITGSGGSKFYKCGLCSQTLCSHESFLVHWKECAVKNKNLMKRLELKEKACNAKPISGEVLENLVSVIADVAAGSGSIPECISLDSEFSDVSDYYCLRDPCKAGLLDMGESSEYPDSDFWYDSADSNSPPEDMSEDGVDTGETGEGSITGSGFTDTMDVSKDGENEYEKDTDEGIKEEENGKEFTQNTGRHPEEMDEEYVSTRKAPPKLRDRKTLKPIHSFINETFNSPFSKTSVKQTNATTDEKLGDETGEDRDKQTSESEEESDGNSLYCKVCRASFQNKRILLQHFAGKHLQPYTVKTVADSSSYFCHLCQKMYPTFMFYMHHVPNHSVTIYEKMKAFVASMKSQQRSQRIALQRGLAKKVSMNQKMARTLKSKKASSKSEVDQLERRLLAGKTQAVRERMKISKRKRSLQSAFTSSEDDYSSDASNNVVFKSKKSESENREPMTAIRLKRSTNQPNQTDNTSSPQSSFEQSEEEEEEDSDGKGPRLARDQDDDYVLSEEMDSDSVDSTIAPPTTRSRNRVALNLGVIDSKTGKLTDNSELNEGVLVQNENDGLKCLPSTPLEDFDADSNCSDLFLSQCQNGRFVPLESQLGVQDRSCETSSIVEDARIVGSGKELVPGRTLTVRHLSRRLKERLKSCDLHPTVVLKALHVDVEMPHRREVSSSVDAVGQQPHSSCSNNFEQQSAQLDSPTQQDDLTSAAVKARNSSFLDSFLSYLNQYPSHTETVPVGRKRCRSGPPRVRGFRKRRSSIDFSQLGETDEEGQANLRHSSSLQLDAPQNMSESEASKSDIHVESSVNLQGAIHGIPSKFPTRQCSVNLGQKLSLEELKANHDLLSRSRGVAQDKHVPAVVGHEGGTGVKKSDDSSSSFASPERKCVPIVSLETFEKIDVYITHSNIPAHEKLRISPPSKLVKHKKHGGEMVAEDLDIALAKDKTLSKHVLACSGDTSTDPCFDQPPHVSSQLTSRHFTSVFQSELPRSICSKLGTRLDSSAQSCSFQSKFVESALRQSQCSDMLDTCKQTPPGLEITSQEARFSDIESSDRVSIDNSPSEIESSEFGLSDPIFADVGPSHCRDIKSPDNGTLNNECSENRTSNNSSVDNQISDNSSVDNQTSNNSPVDNQTSNNSPVDNQTSNNSSVDNQTSNNSSVDNQTSNNSSVDNQTSNNSSVDNQTSNNSSVDNQTSNNSYVDNQTSNNSYVDNQTSNNSSVDNQTSNNSSVDNQTSKNGSADSETSDRSSLKYQDLSREEYLENYTDTGQNDVRIIKNTAVNLSEDFPVEMADNLDEVNLDQICPCSIKHSTQPLILNNERTVIVSNMSDCGLVHCSAGSGAAGVSCQVAENVVVNLIEESEGVGSDAAVSCQSDGPGVRDISPAGGNVDEEKVCGLHPTPAVQGRESLDLCKFIREETSVGAVPSLGETEHHSSVIGVSAETDLADQSHQAHHELHNQSQAYEATDAAQEQHWTPQDVLPCYDCEHVQVIQEPVETPKAVDVNSAEKLDEITESLREEGEGEARSLCDSSDGDDKLVGDTTQCADASLAAVGDSEKVTTCEKADSDITDAGGSLFQEDALESCSVPNVELSACDKESTTENGYTTMSITSSQGADGTELAEVHENAQVCKEIPPAGDNTRASLFTKRAADSDEDVKTQLLGNNNVSIENFRFQQSIAECSSDCNSMETCQTTLAADTSSPFTDRSVQSPGEAISSCVRSVANSVSSSKSSEESLVLDRGKERKPDSQGRANFNSNISLAAFIAERLTKDDLEPASAYKGNANNPASFRLIGEDSPLDICSGRTETTEVNCIGYTDILSPLNSYVDVKEYMESMYITHVNDSFSINFGHHVESTLNIGHCGLEPVTPTYVTSTDCPSTYIDHNRKKPVIPKYSTLMDCPSTFTDHNRKEPVILKYHTCVESPSPRIDHNGKKSVELAYISSTTGGFVNIGSDNTEPVRPVCYEPVDKSCEPSAEDNVTSKSLLSSGLVDYSSSEEEEISTLCGLQKELSAKRENPREEMSVKNDIHEEEAGEKHISYQGKDNTECDNHCVAGNQVMTVKTSTESSDLQSDESKVSSQMFTTDPTSHPPQTGHFSDVGYEGNCVGQERGLPEGCIESQQWARNHLKDQGVGPTLNPRHSESRWLPGSVLENNPDVDDFHLENKKVTSARKQSQDEPVYVREETTNREIPVCVREEKLSQDITVCERKEKLSQDITVCERKEKLSQDITVCERKEKWSHDILLCVSTENRSDDKLQCNNRINCQNALPAVSTCDDENVTLGAECIETGLSQAGNDSMLQECFSEEMLQDSGSVDNCADDKTAYLSDGANLQCYYMCAASELDGSLLSTLTSCVQDVCHQSATSPCIQDVCHQSTPTSSCVQDVCYQSTPTSSCIQDVCHQSTPTSSFVQDVCHQSTPTSSFVQDVCHQSTPTSSCVQDGCHQSTPTSSCVQDVCHLSTPTSSCVQDDCRQSTPTSSCVQNVCHRSTPTSSCVQDGCHQSTPTSSCVQDVCHQSTPTSSCVQDGHPQSTPTSSCVQDGCHRSTPTSSCVQDGCHRSTPTSSCVQDGHPQSTPSSFCVQEISEGTVGREECHLLSKGGCEVFTNNIRRNNFDIQSHKRNREKPAEHEMSGGEFRTVCSEKNVCVITCGLSSCQQDDLCEEEVQLLSPVCVDSGIVIDDNLGAMNCATEVVLPRCDAPRCDSGAGSECDRSVGTSRECTLLVPSVCEERRQAWGATCGAALLEQASLCQNVVESIQGVISSSDAVAQPGSSADNKILLDTVSDSLTCFRDTESTRLKHISDSQVSAKGVSDQVFPKLTANLSVAATVCDITLKAGLTSLSKLEVGAGMEPRMTVSVASTVSALISDGGMSRRPIDVGKTSCIEEPPVRAESDLVTNVHISECDSSVVLSSTVDKGSNFLRDPSRITQSELFDALLKQADTLSYIFNDSPFGISNKSDITDQKTEDTSSGPPFKIRLPSAELEVATPDDLRTDKSNCSTASTPDNPKERTGKNSSGTASRSDSPKERTNKNNSDTASRSDSPKERTNKNNSSSDKNSTGTACRSESPTERTDKNISGPNSHRERASLDNETDDGDDLSDFDLIIENDTSYRSLVSFPATTEKRSYSSVSQHPISPFTSKGKITYFQSNATSSVLAGGFTYSKIPTVDGHQSLPQQPGGFSSRQPSVTAKTYRKSHRQFVWEDDGGSGRTAQPHAAVVAPSATRRTVPARETVSDPSLDTLRRKQKSLREKSETAPFSWDLDDNADNLVSSNSSKVKVRHPSKTNSDIISFERSSHVRKVTTPANKVCQQITPHKRPLTPDTTSGRIPAKFRRTFSVDRPVKFVDKTAGKDLKRRGEMVADEVSKSSLVKNSSQRSASDAHRSVTDTRRSRSDSITVDEDISFKKDSFSSSGGLILSADIQTSLPDSINCVSSHEAKGKRGEKSHRHTHFPSPLNAVLQDCKLESSGLVAEEDSLKSPLGLRSRHSSMESNMSDRSVNTKRAADNNSPFPTKKSRKSEDDPSSPKLKKIGLIKVTKDCRSPSAATGIDSAAPMTRSSEAAIKAFHQKSLRSRGVNLCPLAAVSPSATSKIGLQTPPKSSPETSSRLKSSVTLQKSSPPLSVIFRNSLLESKVESSPKSSRRKLDTVSGTGAVTERRLLSSPVSSSKSSSAKISFSLRSRKSFEQSGKHPQAAVSVVPANLLPSVALTKDTCKSHVALSTKETKTLPSQLTVSTGSVRSKREQTWRMSKDTKLSKEKKRRR